MSDEQNEMLLATVKRQWIGKDVKVTGRHPHQGEIGKVIDFRLAGLANKWGLVVQGELGDFFVFDKSLLTVIP